MAASNGHRVCARYDYLLKFVSGAIAESQAMIERLADMNIGIYKCFGFMVLKSPIVKAHMPLPSLSIQSPVAVLADELGVAHEAVEPGRIELRHGGEQKL